MMYIDVTQLVHWQGPLAGIPRVMDEISRRFVGEKSFDAVYVSWVKELKSYCEIDFFDTMENRGKGIKYLKNNSGNVVNNASQNSFFSISKRRLSQLINMTNLSNTKTYQKIKSHLLNIERNEYRQVAFENGDLVFISWGEWWDENFLKMLEQAEAEQDVKVIPIVHDVLPFTLTPHFSGHSTDSLKEYCKRIIPISALVLCVSNATLTDLKMWLKNQNIVVPTMKVFREGDDFDFKKPIMPSDKVFKESKLKGNDFIVCVGTVEAKKNHTLLYYVYKLAKSRNISLPPIIIIGRRGYKTEIVEEFMTTDPEVKGKFIFLHNATDENLSWLYDHSLMSIFPSFSEGWGLPVAESVARGVPCIASNTTSLPEVAPGYARYFTPSSTDECLALIQDTLKPRTQQSMRRQYESYKQTTWDESFREIRGLMKEVLNV